MKMCKQVLMGAEARTEVCASKKESRICERRNQEFYVRLQSLAELSTQLSLNALQAAKESRKATSRVNVTTGASV
jgi:hypothetical protein